MRVKRFIDIAASLALLILLSPLILISIILVDISSPGEAIFRQLRMGLKERQFICYKLRSMYVNQQPMNGVTETSRRPGEILKFKNDPRVTPVGAFIRKASIDELPQLFNVLIGDMSLVGPRPLVPHMLDPFLEFRSCRCAVRPGITGLWQVRSRHNNTSVLDMVTDDLEYIDNIGIFLDLRILIATVPAVLRARGAH